MRAPGGRPQKGRPGKRGSRSRIDVRMRLRAGLGLSAAGIAAGVYLFVTWYGGPAESEILGRPMTHWIDALRSPDLEERADAAYALSLSDSVAPTACRALAGRLTDEYEVRSHVRATLGHWTRRGRCIDDLVEVLVTSPVREERTEAADALKNVGRSLRPMVPDLLPLLRDPDAGVRSRVAGLVARARDASPAIQNALVEMEADPEPVVRASAVEAMADLPISKGRFLALAERTANDGDPRVRTATMKALGRGPESESIPLLVHGLGDRQAEVREAAAWSLGSVEEPTEIAPRALSNMTDDPDARVRRAANEGLSRLRERRSR